MSLVAGRVWGVTHHPCLEVIRAMSNPIECWCDLQLPSKQKNTAKGTVCNAYLAERFLADWFWWYKWPCEGPHDVKNWDWPLGAERGLQPTVCKKVRPSILKCKKMNSANNLSDLRREFFPSWAFRWEPSPDDTLIAVWQIAQLSCACTSVLWKLWENKYTLF